uniref:Proton-dependent oligopeptide transporter family, major facilitator superfamily n=1 Tax=Medicago truncatula TaxID=3880 RepID=B7FM42_MEDTR|nr:unknown [Medicago truncatula]
MEEEKGIRGNGKMVEKESKRQQRGGIRTLPFILANEVCDRFASAGFHANMITYLTQQLNMPLVSASNTLSNFSGLSSLTPLLGAFIADSFAGRFWTIVFATLIYELGLITITTSAIVPHFRPPPCPTQVNCQEAKSSQLWILYLALFLTSLGSGGIRSCVVPFSGDQFDMTKKGVESRKWNLFNWYFFCMGFASLSALTIVAYIQDHMGWGLGSWYSNHCYVYSYHCFSVGIKTLQDFETKWKPISKIGSSDCGSI